MVKKQHDCQGNMYSYRGTVRYLRRDVDHFTWTSNKPTVRKYYSEFFGKNADPDSDPDLAKRYGSGYTTPTETQEIEKMNVTNSTGIILF